MQRDPSARRHNVYVIELDEAAGDGATPCFYVGETALAPEARFAKHMSGAQVAARVVHRFGRRLRPDLSKGVGPFHTREQALAAEALLATRLRRRGFVVFGGQGEPLMQDRR